MSSVCKKGLSIILSICMMLSLAQFAAAAEINGVELDFDFQVEEDGTTFYFKVIEEGSNEVKLVNPYAGRPSQNVDFTPEQNATMFHPVYSGEVNVPGTVTYEDTEYTVTAIGSAAFHSAKVTKVTLPETITAIGASAFAADVEAWLTEVDLSECTSLTSIGNNAFSGQRYLAAISLPDSLTELGYGAFYDCAAIESLVIPEGVTEIGSQTFFRCSSLKSLTMGDGVTSIGKQAFVSCGNLTDLELPDEVTTIGSQAFAWCSSLTALELPAGVTTIGKQAFAGCSFPLTIPAGVTSGITDALDGYQGKAEIEGESPFQEQDGIRYENGEIVEWAVDVCSESITILDGATTIPACFFDNYADADTSGLKSVTIPSSIKVIGDGAFTGCSALESVTLSEGLEEICTGAFSYTAINNITIPASVKTIGAQAFEGCFQSAGATLTLLGDGCQFTGDLFADPGMIDLLNDLLEAGVYDSIEEGAEDLGICYPKALTVIVPAGSVETYTAAFAGYEFVTVMAPKVPVTSVTVNAAEDRNLTVGDTLNLTVNVAPENATDKTVTWSSSSEAVAAVAVAEDGTVTVTAVGEGAATITATATDGSNVSGACTVTVSPATVAVESVTVTANGSTTLYNGEVAVLTAEVLPADATDKTVSWTSSNDAVATVADGRVTAVGEGTATITATAGGASGTCEITVLGPAPVPVDGVTVNPAALSLTVGGTGTLTANVSPDDATSRDVTWTSSDTTVAAVSGGVVTAVGTGTAIITATAANGQTASCTVTVTQPVTGISVNPASISLTEGGTRTLTASVSPSNATAPTVTWTSSNTAVATVSASGVVTAVSAGSATITATAGGQSATCAVSVSPYYYDPYYPSYPTGGSTTTRPSTTTPTTTITDTPTPLDPGTEIADQETPLANIPLAFTDVKAGEWHRDAIAYVVSKGMMNGTTTTTFEPETKIDRGMIVTMLHRLEGAPAAEASTFTDVAAGQWYADAVNWAAANGVVNGYSATEFAPERKITREQLAAILYRYAVLKGYSTYERADLSGYADASSVSEFAAEAMSWAVAMGLISGVTTSALEPGGDATRAQAAMILMRFCENVAAAPAATDDDK